MPTDKSNIISGKMQNIFDQEIMATSELSHERTQLEINNINLQETHESKEIVAKSDPDEVLVKLGNFEFLLVFVSLALGVFLVAIDFTIVSTALPAIAGEFQSLDQIAWVGSAFLLSSTGFSSTYGSLCDIFGRKTTLLLAITIFEGGSLLCGAAPTMTALILGRFIAGIGGGGLYSCVLIIIADIVSLRDRGKYQGMIGAVFGLSSIIGPLLGGIFTDKISWRWCFYINLPIGAVTALVVVVFLKFPSPQGSMLEKMHKIDFLGTFAVVAAASFFLVPIQFGGIQWEWNSLQVILFFCASIVMSLFFVWTQVKFSKSPLIPPSMFENRSVGLILAIAFLIGNCFFTVSFYVPTFFQLVWGESATIAGLESIPLLFGVVGLSIASGISISVTGRYKMWFFIGPVFSIVGMAFLTTLRLNTSRVAEVFYLLLCGIGLGSLVQVFTLAIQASVEKRNIAVATSTSVFMLNLGGCFGVAIGGTILTNSLTKQLGDAVADQVLQNPAGIRSLPDWETVVDGIAQSLAKVYYWAIPCAALIFILAFGVQEYISTDQKEDKENVVVVVH